jgi:hypothetical protein
MGFFNPPTGGGGGVTSWSGGPTGLTPASPTTGAVVLGGLLGTGYGGTNSTATPTAGAVAFGDGSKYTFTAAGTAGQYLQSTGAGTPTWTTISNSGVGSTGYYASLYDDGADQTAASTTAAYVIRIGTTAEANGISVVTNGTYLSRITVANAGTYTFTPSIQFVSANTSIHDVSLWFRKNGTDIADSNSQFSVPNKHGGVNGNLIATVALTVTLAAGDYIELAWSTTSTDVSIRTYPAGTTPTNPVVPGVIVSVTSQAQIGIGYYNLTSTTSTLIGTGSKTFTVSTPSTSSAFTVGTRVRVAYTTTPSNWMEGVITAFSSTSLTVNVDTVGGSGTYAAWTFSVAGVNNSSLVVGTTAITGGTTTRVLYDNAGVVGEYSSVPIANGGTGQATAGAAFNALSPITSTGDLILGNGTNSATRLGIGTSGYVLTSNGTTASWAVTAITLGTTTVSGTSGYVLYNNAGTVGSLSTTGTAGSPVVLSASPTFTGTPLSTTAAQATNNTQIATTAYVDRVAVQQVVSTITGAVATGTTVIPFDDTIPQNTEGDQYMTLAITPKSATSKLVINVVWCGSHNGGATTLIVALFQDSTANALAVTDNTIGNTNYLTTIPLNYTMTSGTTSATTFKVRVGGNAAGTTTFNGQNGARSFGGVMASSIVITEIGV